MAAQVYVARVFQPQKALDCDQRNLKGDAVKPFYVPSAGEFFRQGVFVPKNVVKRGVSDYPLRSVVAGYAVVVENGKTDDGEQRQRD